MTSSGGSEIRSVAPHGRRIATFGGGIVLVGGDVVLVEIASCSGSKTSPSSSYQWNEPWGAHQHHEPGDVSGEFRRVASPS